jgi:hypothetical protein
VRKYCLIIICNLVFLNGISAQTDVVVQDSTTVNQDGYGIFKMFDGNPGKAALYSVILPGAGQLFNKRYWKVPFALAAEGATIYFLVQNISEFKKWDAEWKFQLLNKTNNPDVVSVYDPNAIKKIRDNARQQKDYTWLALIGVHILVSADAFIDRHLIEFDVSDDLSLKINPVSPYLGLNIAMQF